MAHYIIIMSLRQERLVAIVMNIVRNLIFAREDGDYRLEVAKANWTGCMMNTTLTRQCVIQFLMVALVLL